MYWRNPEIEIPDSELVITATKAGGPGGQHVNKTSTKINLSWNLTRSNALTDEEKDTVARKLPPRMLKIEDTAEGPEVIVKLSSSSTRSQHKNREAAKQRLHLAVNNALKPKKKRKATKVPRKAKERRIQDKKRQGQKKQGRRGGFEDNPFDCRGVDMYRYNPSEYTDDELIFTALRNMAGQEEYNDRALYQDVINTIHNKAFPDVALRTKIIAVDRLFIRARSGDERKQAHLPQIRRIQAALRDEIIHPSCPNCGGSRRNPWDDSGISEPVSKSIRRLCRSDLTPEEISDHLNVPVNWVASTCQAERQGPGWRRKPWRRNADGSLRDLERQAARGDAEAKERLDVMRERLGLPPGDGPGSPGPGGPPGEPPFSSPRPPSRPRGEPWAGGLDTRLRRLEREYAATGDPQILEMINLLRERAGLPPYGTGNRKRNPRRLRRRRRRNPYRRNADLELRELERQAQEDPEAQERLDALRERMGLTPDIDTSPTAILAGALGSPYTKEIVKELLLRERVSRRNLDKEIYPYQAATRLSCDTCGTAVHPGETCEATCMETENGALLSPHAVKCEHCVLTGRRLF
jgi:ribosome-associated protein